MAQTAGSLPGSAAARAAEEAAFYHEAGLNAAWTGSRLAMGALSFLFGAFLFAYFYLRSLNSHGMWLPSGFIRPHVWSGTLIMGLVVVSAAVQTAALQLIKAGNKDTWQRGAIAGPVTVTVTSRPVVSCVSVALMCGTYVPG